MTSPTLVHRRRSVPLAVLILAAIAAALLTVTTSSESAHASPADHKHGNSQFLPLRTSAQVSFHDQLRKLWEDHITWTRLAIVTFADGSNGFSATATRLLQNQTDIGNEIVPFYGRAAGDKLSALLHDHITIAVEVLQAAKSGDAPAFADAKARWYANANDIADVLAAANPRFWPRDTMRAAMKEHLDETLTEASDELSGDFAASVADYEAVHLHILVMADLLSSGIMRQFPGRFH
jgi:hypothetical protein